MVIAITLTGMIAAWSSTRKGIMYETILVPLDGSKRAEAILPHVETMANRFGSTVLLLQVVEPNIMYASPYDTYPELDLEVARQRADEVDDYLSHVEERLSRLGIAARRQVEYGPVVLSILEVAESEDVDLIAMASHGRSGLARVFYGSVAAGVLQRIDRPLLLIRAQ
jgi:nucleotide-binding universal stress UspA family protein